jgi:hypothetical protein
MLFVMNLSVLVLLLPLDFMLLKPWLKWLIKVWWRASETILACPSNLGTC